MALIFPYMHKERGTHQRVGHTGGWGMVEEEASMYITEGTYHT